MLLEERELALLLTMSPLRWAHVVRTGAFSKGIHSAHTPTCNHPRAVQSSHSRVLGMAGLGGGHPYLCPLGGWTLQSWPSVVPCWLGPELGLELGLAQARAAEGLVPPAPCWQPRGVAGASGGVTEARGCHWSQQVAGALG